MYVQYITYRLCYNHQKHSQITHTRARGKSRHPVKETLVSHDAASLPPVVASPVYEQSGFYFCHSMLLSILKDLQLKQGSLVSTDKASLVLALSYSFKHSTCLYLPYFSNSEHRLNVSFLHVSAHGLAVL